MKSQETAKRKQKEKSYFLVEKKNQVDGFIVDNKIIKECDDRIRKHVLDCREVILRGEHNYENIATAFAATKDLVDIDVAVEAVKEFKPVEHRLEFVREINDVKWYNDSVSSSPTRTIAV